MTPRKSKKDELTQEMILDTAREIFVKKGYKETSMRVIAKELNCSHGAIYYYFKDKAELLYAIINADFQLLNNLIDTILQSNKSNGEKLRAILFSYLQFGLENKSHYEVMFLMKREGGGSESGPNVSYEKFAHALHQLGGGTISIKQIWSVFLALHGFVSQYCWTNQTFEDVKQLAESHVDFIWKGLNLEEMM